MALKRMGIVDNYAVSTVYVGSRLVCRLALSRCQISGVLSQVGVRRIRKPTLHQKFNLRQLRKCGVQYFLQLFTNLTIKPTRHDIYDTFRKSATLALSSLALGVLGALPPNVWHAVEWARSSCSTMTKSNWQT